MAYVTQPVGSTGSSPSITSRALPAGVAETTTPTPVSDGEVVDVWFDEYGRQILKGYDAATGTLKVKEVTPELAQTLDMYTTPMLDAVGAIGASSAYNVSLHNKLTFHIIASGVTTGATVKIQHTIDGTNWVDVDTQIIVANGVYEVKFSNLKYYKIRANITAWTDGTYTVVGIGGR